MLHARGELRQLEEVGRPGAILVRPVLPAHVLPHQALDGHEGGVGVEPVGLALAERLEGLALVRPQLVHACRDGVLAALEQVGVARERREPGIGAAEAVGGVHREDLPVVLAAVCQPVAEGAGRGAERAGLPVVGHRGDVADDGRAALGLEAQGLARDVQHRRPQLGQRHRGPAILDHDLAAGHDVGHAAGRNVHPDLVDALEAAVDQHDGALPRRGARAPEAKDLVAQVDGLEVAVTERRERGPEHGGVAIDGLAVAVLVAPGVGRAVIGVGVSLDAGLVAVVDARDAGERHLEQGRDPEPALGEAALAVAQAIGGALVVGEGLLRGCPAQDGEDALGVMAPQHVEGARERAGRVVLAHGLDALGEVARRREAQHVAQQRVAQVVVHGAVELVAQEVAAQLAIAHLVGGVLPDLAQHERVRTLGKRGGRELLDEVVGQLVHHVEPPAARAGAQPVAHGPVLAKHERAEARVVLLEVGQVLDAPPAEVLPILAYLEPGAVGRVLALGGTDPVVVAKGVEVTRVAAGMVEDPVEDDRDAHLRGLGAEPAELALVAQHGVHGEVVARVIAMPARRLEDGVEVERRDPELAQVAKVLADAREGAPVEVPLAYGPILVPAVARRGVPVLDQRAPRPARMLGQGLLHALAPLGTAREAVGEDLVDDAAVKPVGLLGTRLVHGELERRLAPLAQTALPAHAPRLGAAPQRAPVAHAQRERVPHDGGLVRRKPHGEADAALERLARHGQDGLALAVDPDAQVAGGGLLVQDVNGQGDGGAELDGAEGAAIGKVAAVVMNPHWISFVVGAEKRAPPLGEGAPSSGS